MLKKYLSMTKAFAVFDARLANYQWAVSAIAHDGALVYSCMNELLKARADGFRYTDDLRRWPDNRLGNRLAAEHLALARNENRPVRLVIATTKTDVVAAGAKARGQTKWSVAEEMEGRVTSFNGKKFVIDFRSNSD